MVDGKNLLQNLLFDNALRPWLSVQAKTELEAFEIALDNVRPTVGS